MKAPMVTMTINPSQPLMSSIALKPSTVALYAVEVFDVSSSTSVCTLDTIKAPKASMIATTTMANPRLPNPETELGIGSI